MLRNVIIVIIIVTLVILAYIYGVGDSLTTE